MIVLVTRLLLGFALSIVLMGIIILALERLSGMPWRLPTRRK